MSLKPKEQIDDIRNQYLRSPRRLGHSSIQITLNTYSHVAPGLQKSAAEMFDNIFLPNGAIYANSNT